LSRPAEFDIFIKGHMLVFGRVKKGSRIFKIYLNIKIIIFYVIVTELLLELGFSNKTIGNPEITLSLLPNPFAVILMVLETVSLLLTDVFFFKSEGHFLCHPFIKRLVVNLEYT